MSFLKWLIWSTFPAGLLFAVLAFVFRVDAHAMAFPQPWLLGIALALLVIGTIATAVWAAIKVFGG